MFVYLKKVAKENEDREERRQEQNKMRRMEHHKKLQEQIETCRQKRVNYNMTDQERNFNTDRIIKLKAIAQENPDPIVDVLSVFPRKSGERGAARRPKMKKPIRALPALLFDRPPPPRRPAPFRLDTDYFMAN